MRFISSIVIALTAGIITLNAATPAPLLKIAESELKRSYDQLQKEKSAPYFMGYGIIETDAYTITGVCGKLESDRRTNDRVLDVEVRVGDYQMDNSHIIRGQAFSFSRDGGAFEMPLDDNEKAIKSVLWYHTDRAYKNAVEQVEKAKTNKAVKVAEEDTAADFSREKPSVYSEDILKNNFDAPLWRDNIRKLSDLFTPYPWIYNSYVSVSAKVTNKYMVNTEGTEVQISEPYYRVMISISTKADDGMDLPLFKDYFSHNANGFPSIAVIEKDIRQMIEVLDLLRKAPVLQNYSGPAILSGEASGVFFHEIFGHRVEGHRLKNPKEAQTFKNSIDELILPEFINVYFDPALKEYKGHEISGNYVYDDEAVRGKRVDAVIKGKFKDFLMCRRPVNNFLVSNGHGRKQAGYGVVSRQSNLIVEAVESVTFENLKKMLIKECKKTGKEYGLYFVQVGGGFTITGTGLPNAFNVNPRVVYKIYADGRPDELVRGVDLIGTPKTAFKNIIGAADDLGVFNGICGAESGGVPVSSCSPSLLVSFIEAQKKGKSEAKPPILPAPEQSGPNN